MKGRMPVSVEPGYLEHLATNRYFDRTFDCDAVKVLPGEYFVTTADILLVTPQDLKSHVDRVARAAAARHGFLGHRAYVARVGRGRQIELFFIVPQGAPARTLEEWDAIRDEVGDQIGDEGPDRWLTIAFTTDPEWAD